MAPGEKAKEDHYSDSRLFTDGMDDILDRRDRKNGAPNMGPV